MSDPLSDWRAEFRAYRVIYRAADGVVDGHSMWVTDVDSRVETLRSIGGTIIRIEYRDIGPVHDVKADADLPAEVSRDE